MVYRRFSRLRQVSIALAAFAAFLLVVDSGGLYSWADRLELGPERSVALPLATGLNRALRPLGLERLRQRELAQLARVGWSDDPAALAAEDSGKAAPASSPEGTGPAPAGAADANTAPANSASAPSTDGAATAGTTAASACDGGTLPAGLKTSVLGGKLPDLHLPGAQPPVQVGLAGDSMMAVGLSSTIYQHAGAYPKLSFVKTFKSGTGLARPEVFNWQTEYPAMLAQAQPEVVLVAIGANDGQGFVDGGTTYPFGTPGWKQVYTQRLQAYLHMLEASHAKVVWLGLPPMRSANYNSHIQLINCLAYSVVSADPSAVWVATDTVVGDDAGTFRDFGVVNGKEVRLRQNDGIHMSNEGAALVADPILTWLNAQVQAPGIPGSPAGPAPAAVPGTPPSGSASPGAPNTPK